MNRYCWPGLFAPTKLGPRPNMGMTDRFRKKTVTPTLNIIRAKETEFA
jgi:hypothetical protein